MLRNSIATCFLLFSLFLQAQQGSRWFFTFGPSVATGNRFEGDKTVIDAADVTGKHTIQPLFSPLWGRPNPEYSGMQNLGRKIHLGFRYERFFYDRHSFLTGLEIGSRGYVILSEHSSDLLINYRNFNLPVLYAHTSKLGSYWALRKNLGVCINYASSIPKFIEGSIELKKGGRTYPTLYVGLELVPGRFVSSFSFEVSYAHGFYNIIDHNYLALDYRSPVKISANGSAFSISVKYLLFQKEKELPEKETELNKYDRLVYRKIGKAQEVVVKNATIEICVFDDQTIDGDSVAIEFNNVLIKLDVPLSREGVCIPISVVAGRENLLVVHALNEGKIPPNTCVIRVKEGEELRSFHLRADMQNSGAIRFIREP